MKNKSTRKTQLLKMRKIIKDTGALDYAQNQIKSLYARAAAQISSLNMDPKYKQALEDFSRKILKT
jgi:geranylgeranyl pyrophosphate synthase